ncbi:hypothetical protein EG329_005062 [Mollisiaceae sp. DMI_Dod_QoI]|nr:hypothetical protein EG329_005062 [Helotiales sp. DMI_Dod_QoI]
MSLTPDAIIGLVTLLVGLPPSILLISRWVHRRQKAVEEEDFEPRRSPTNPTAIEMQVGLNTPRSTVILYRASGS